MINTDLEQLARDLQLQRKVLEELLAVLRAEPAPAAPPIRKSFLGLLSESLDRIRQHRAFWLRLDPAEKLAHSEITELLRENQNVILKLLVLDKERAESAKAKPPQRAPDRPAESPAGRLLSRIYSKPLE